MFEGFNEPGVYSSEIRQTLTAASRAQALKDGSDFVAFIPAAILIGYKLKRAVGREDHFG
jgi:hypothetical protein